MPPALQQRHASAMSTLARARATRPARLDSFGGYPGADGPADLADVDWQYFETNEADDVEHRHRVHLITHPDFAVYSTLP